MDDEFEAEFEAELHQAEEDDEDKEECPPLENEEEDEVPNEEDEFEAEIQTKEKVMEQEILNPVKEDGRLKNFMKKQIKKIQKDKKEKEMWKGLNFFENKIKMQTMENMTNKLHKLATELSNYFKQVYSCLQFLWLD